MRYTDEDARAYFAVADELMGVLPSRLPEGVEITRTKPLTGGCQLVTVKGAPVIGFVSPMWRREGDRVYVLWAEGLEWVEV